MGLTAHLQQAKAILWIVEETLLERGEDPVFFNEPDEHGNHNLTPTGRNVAARILMSLEEVLPRG